MIYRHNPSGECPQPAGHTTAGQQKKHGREPGKHSQHSPGNQGLIAEDRIGGAQQQGEARCPVKLTWRRRNSSICLSNSETRVFSPMTIARRSSTSDSNFIFLISLTLDH